MATISRVTTAWPSRGWVGAALTSAAIWAVDLTANVVAVIQTGDGITTQLNADGAALGGSLTIVAAILYGLCRIRDGQAAIRDGQVAIGVRIARLNGACRDASATHNNLADAVRGNSQSVDRAARAVHEIGGSFVDLAARTCGPERSALPSQRQSFLN